jgi:hypothetical protein
MLSGSGKSEQASAYRAALVSRHDMTQLHAADGPMGGIWRLLDVAVQCLGAAGAADRIEVDVDRSNNLVIRTVW